MLGDCEPRRTQPNSLGAYDHWWWTCEYKDNNSNITSTSSSSSSSNNNNRNIQICMYIHIEIQAERDHDVIKLSPFCHATVSSWGSLLSPRFGERMVSVLVRVGVSDERRRVAVLKCLTEALSLPEAWLFLKW